MPAHVAFCKHVSRTSAPVASAVPTSGQMVANSATSTVSADSADVALVKATSDVYVAFGVAPTADQTQHFMTAGQMMVFDDLQAGWKMAVTAA